jgi:thiosulfate dehydrogenase (quinone) large subunit
MVPPPRAVLLTGWAVLPLRAFLGFTFCFAGLQKLANPAFFDASNPSSIQAQLAGAAKRSPIHGLVGPLAHVAIPLGVLIALSELAAGLGTLLGLWTRIAAAGGAAISLSLFLTVSFHSSPYYTGSDIVFVFAWIPLVLAGSGGVLALDAVVANLVHEAAGLAPETVVALPAGVASQAADEPGARAPQRRGRGPGADGGHRLPAPAFPPTSRERQRLVDRRSFALKGLWGASVAVAGVIGATLTAGIGRLAASSTAPQASTGTGQPRTPTTLSSKPTSGGGSKPRTTGTRIGAASAVAVGGAASFQDPTSGDPSLVVRPSADRFLAFDAVCPHAGCIVQYLPADRRFACPCHGSVFNGETGAVEQGPAPTGLTAITVTEGPDGQLYVT